MIAMMLGASSAFATPIGYQTNLMVLAHGGYRFTDFGAVGGLLGWAWMRGTNLIRAHVLVPFKLGPRHILKGLLGGAIIGAIGVLHPETLFWAEHESQTIISHGEESLPHAWPKVGVLGAYSLENPLVLISIGLFKLLAISITVLAGYRGGFIFPFMFAGLSMGTALAGAPPPPQRPVE